MFRKIFTVSIVMVFFLVNSASAAWVDDWINQKTSTGPDHFNTQTRGFGTFGSFSARWKMQNDYLVSVTPPSFKSGCGGVDLFLGGYSFLQFDQLVQKFQRILGPAAAAFAFDIAMSVLSEQTSKSMKSLAAMVDRLNQLQFDDCSATKNLTAVMKTGVDPQASAEDRTNAVKDFIGSTGLSDLYSSVVDLGKSKTTEQAAAANGANLNQMVQGCSQEMKDIYFTDGSLLQHLADKKSLPSGYVDLMRGLVGDYIINGMDYAPVSECPENYEGKTIDDWIAGDIQKRDQASLACQKITSLNIDGKTYASIYDWVLQSLTTIAQKMGTKSAGFTAAEKGFMAAIPAPIYKAMQVDVGNEGVSSAAQIAMRYTEFVATAMVYNMIGDFYSTIDKVVSLSEVTYEAAAQGAAPGKDQDTCKIEFAEPVIEGLKQKRTILRDSFKNTHNQYAAKLDQLQATMELNWQIQQRLKDFHAKTSKLIGSGAMKRLSLGL